jgi:hypothetical protein
MNVSLVIILSTLSNIETQNVFLKSFGHFSRLYFEKERRIQNVWVARDKVTTNEKDLFNSERKTIIGIGVLFYTRQV